MVDFLSVVYTRAQKHRPVVVVGLFLVLCALVVLQSIFSPLAVLAVVLTLFFIVLSFVRPLWTIGFLALYLPFESLVLKFTPDEVYLFVRYFSESLIYLVVLVVVSRIVTREERFRPSTVDLPFILFCVVLVASAILNAVPPAIAILGLRQILRFVLVFFLVVQLRPSVSFIRAITTALLAVVVFQAGLGIVQSIVGEPLDQFLLPSEVRVAGEITLTGGVQQFWDPGSRVFATLGRYDRLGNFLYVGLLIAIAFLFEHKHKVLPAIVPWVIALGVPALALTFSRASWFAFFLGAMFIWLVLRRDKRVLIGFASFMIVVVGYLSMSGLRSIHHRAPGQTFVERFYETFSYARWRGVQDCRLLARAYAAFGRLGLAGVWIRSWAVWWRSRCGVAQHSCLRRT